MPRTPRLARALFVLASCRSAGPARSPEHGQSVHAPPAACRDPAATYATYAWLPAEVQAIVTVLIHDDRLSTSITTLENRTVGPFVPGDPAWTRFAAELPELRALLATTGLTAPEATFFVADDIGVWSVPGRCEPDAFNRLAAVLGLRERDQSDGVRVAASASLDGHTLVQRAAGDPLWIVRAREVDTLLGWLRRLDDPRPNPFSEQLHAERDRGVVRVYLADWSVHTSKHYLVTGTQLQGRTIIDCFVGMVDKP